MPPVAGCCEVGATRVAGGALLLLASGGPLLLFYWASVALSLLLVHGLWIMTAVAVLVFIVNVVRG